MVDIYLFLVFNGFVVPCYLQVDPLVSLMMVEKVPDSTYEMVGGLDKQIKEIKEVLSTLMNFSPVFIIYSHLI